MDADSAFVLDSWGAVRVSGADAENFLQGQLSADLRALKPDRAAWGSYNSPKGRMLAVMLMVRDGETVELWMPRDLVEPISRRLRMFVLRSKVAIEAPGPRFWVAVLGAGAAGWIAARGLPVPADPLSIASAENLAVLRAAGAAPRFAVIGTPEALAPLPLAPFGSLESWREADIRAGIPVVYSGTQDRWVAQMANLDLLGGISFEKGCYTGQEIVARLHYLGNLKRRMFLVRGPGVAPEPGTLILVSADRSQAVGEIVDAATTAEGFVATAVLQNAALTLGNLALAREIDSELETPDAFLY